ncbi:MAG: class I SAM-dependent methyltransferase [Rhabdochlamydiaceae bacterium]
MLKNKNLEKFYDKVYTKGEEKHYTKFVIQGTPTSETDEVLKQDRWKGKTVLEVGCGTGLFSFHAAKKGANVLGIDFSEKGIKIAQKKYKLSNLRFEKLDVINVKGKYDIIVSIGVLEHMDNPLRSLKLFKKHLKSNGKIIITSPNWSNPRGYVLMTIRHLFKAPVTLADIHYLTPIDFINWAKKMSMNIAWKTFDRSWGHGDLMIKDFSRRIPNVLRDAKLPNDPKNIDNLLNWLKQNVASLENSLPHSGALGIYIFSKKKQVKTK